jgi:NAD(P)-dependent dehydrogenase (short-subunit alcohol dehydrogenase family)/rhamnose utilization protein RhaD (predicted bifunctional aldolase and dehydrogenase)
MKEPKYSPKSAELTERKKDNTMSLSVLKEYSNRYGKDKSLVLAGGGNTSFKDGDTLYVKGSGTSLATIDESGFVVMNRTKLAEIWQKKYSDVTSEREAQVLADMMAARRPGEEAKRPSVETLLHDLFPQKYILHVHPAKVNAITCSQKGQDVISELFPDAVWIDECEPGYKLAAKCRQELIKFRDERGSFANLLFLQNHGIFFAANSREELDELVSSTMSKIESQIKKESDFTDYGTDTDTAAKIAPVLRMLYDRDGNAAVKFTCNNEIAKYAADEKAFSVLKEPISPDHIVYCKAEPLFIDSFEPEAIAERFNAFVERRGFKPKVVFAKGTGLFTIGNTAKEAATVLDVWTDCMTVTSLAENFGGVRHMAPAMQDFIINWEAESYRAKVSLSQGAVKPLKGKIAIVTGSAQGFGAGIAEYLANAGASVVIADMNLEGAKSTADAISEKCGVPALAVFANVSDEASVENMIKETVLNFGGLDVFVNNAGIVRAGSLDEMTKQNFELVTAVNYTAYFLCAKYASKIMKIQRSVAPEYITDIIEINSKSGLSGSNKNFAYAGSKFGGLGLTQSFAMELAPYGIKVNAVCPGNFLDGPLWSDPVKGLFVQYLNAGKVPGARTVDDVRKFYEAKVPLGRGCRIEDVAKAVLYIIDQKYETGQAVPVTGGQEMLK